MKLLRAVLRKKTWDIVVRPKMLGDPFGECDSPDTPDKEIRIYGAIGSAREQRGLLLVDTVLHEALHACFWDLDDEVVHEAAADLARLLSQLGLLATDARLSQDP